MPALTRHPLHSFARSSPPHRARVGRTAYNISTNTRITRTSPAAPSRPPDLKKQFTAVDNKAKVGNYGQLLAAVLGAYADGGRAARIPEMLRAVVADRSKAADQTANAIPASGAGGEQHGWGGDR